MPWIQLKINVKAAHAESLGDALNQCGAQAVTFVDAKDTPMYEPKPGEIMLWPDTTVIGLFDANDDMQLVVEQLVSDGTINQGAVYALDQLEDKDWEREWMDNFHPMQFGEKLWICPSWRDIPDPDAVNVMLDPGLAFGTGTHPTTSLCLKWLDSVPLHNKQVVDFGCGSGILGIAALKLGAEHVVAIDIDPQALLATRQNAQHNHVSEKISVFLPNAQPDMKADVVVANILASPLRELRSVITNYCKPGGQLILSGILVEQAEEIAALYASDFTIDDISHQGEWASVAGTRRTASST
ncbi:50S ribosomal protein L11 methyltransferase [Aestuariibacter salexigens]|uniref:50S ribosomal protein L11 methyltransferase n=1 Tax=Aestuariibacter salexigens TaxID=226010 RepID=UPI00040CC289|nr:50S ribosomal protein L11 methyltransferase [Aestuariibacter salexigens]